MIKHCPCKTPYSFCSILLPIVSAQVSALLRWFPLLWNDSRNVALMMGSPITCRLLIAFLVTVCCQGDDHESRGSFDTRWSSCCCCRIRFDSIPAIAALTTQAAAQVMSPCQSPEPLNLQNSFKLLIFIFLCWVVQNATECCSLADALQSSYLQSKRGIDYSTRVGLNLVSAMMNSPCGRSTAWSSLVQIRCREQKEQLWQWGIRVGGNVAIANHQQRSWISWFLSCPSPRYHCEGWLWNSFLHQAHICATCASYCCSMMGNVSKLDVIPLPRFSTLQPAVWSMVAYFRWQNRVNCCALEPAKCTTLIFMSWRICWDAGIKGWLLHSYGCHQQ